jgi:hypothetical protein
MSEKATERLVFLPFFALCAFVVFLYFLFLGIGNQSSNCGSNLAQSNEVLDLPRITQQSMGHLKSRPVLRIPLNF